MPTDNGAMLALLFAAGSLGDILPFLGIGRALLQRGHSVSFITTPRFQMDVRTAGLDYIELDDGAAFDRRVEELGDRRGQVPPGELVEAFSIVTPVNLYRAIARHYRKGETLIGASPPMSLGGAALAREHLGIPYAAIFHTPASLKTASFGLPSPLQRFEDALWNFYFDHSRAMKGLRIEIAALRENLQLPRVVNTFQAAFHSQDATIALFPESFTPGLRSRWPGIEFTGFPMYERPQSLDLPADVNGFLSSGSPPVMISYASWISNLGAFVDASIAACHALNVRAAVLGDEYEGSAVRRGDILFTGRSRFKGLLPHCAAVVHHGGIGTIAAVMAAGLPQMAAPVGLDQVENARCMEKAGVGISVSRKRYERNATPHLARLLALAHERPSRADRSQFIGPHFEAACAKLTALVKV